MSWVGIVPAKQWEHEIEHSKVFNKWHDQSVASKFQCVYRGFSHQFLFDTLCSLTHNSSESSFFIFWLQSNIKLPFKSIDFDWPAWCGVNVSVWFVQLQSLSQMRLIRSITRVPQIKNGIVTSSVRDKLTRRTIFLSATASLFICWWVFQLAQMETCFLLSLRWHAHILHWLRHWHFWSAKPSRSSFWLVLSNPVRFSMKFNSSHNLCDISVNVSDNCYVVHNHLICVSNPNVRARYITTKNKCKKKIFYK